MNQHRIGEISAEMCGLLEHQAKLLNHIPLAKMTTEELDVYAERNQRLRDLCKELTEI